MCGGARRSTTVRSSTGYGKEASRERRSGLYLREALPEARLIEARDLMFEVRLCPSEEELNWYRKGARLCDLAFEAAVDAARPGMKEYELVGVIHGTYLRHGGSLYGAAR